jgi:hypothetical protein
MDERLIKETRSKSLKKADKDCIDANVSASFSNDLLCENKKPTLDDLAMIVKRLVRQLRKHNDSDDVADKAMDYLKRNNLNRPFHL